MTFDKPIRPTKQPSSAPQKTNLATQKVVPNPVKKVIPNIIGGGGNSGNKGGGVSGGGGNGGNNQEPSPWLNHPHHTLTEPTEASFVEYLRWMRSLDQDPKYKNETKTQILQMAQEGVNYQERLKALNQRTEKISNARRGMHFKVMCPWRMRVGGHRGPESILLPSFDALGVPYLPSSTLTGVARAAAIREFMERDNLSWQNAEKKIAAYFGSIEATDSKNRAGKVVFLDAYPEASKSAGLAMDMANSIWRWEGDRIGDYSPNPNSFFSLKDVTFVIGVCRMSNCDDDTFIQVKKWLIKGLQSGIGSQINSGYGSMGVENEPSTHQPFLKLDFDIEGQLIHANKRFKDIKQPYRFDKGRLRDNLMSEPEVRSVAFKSMLRYWFRSFALGVLPAIGEQGVKAWEAKLFGSIDPATWGWVKFDLVAGKQYEPSQKEAGLQQGILRLYFSPSAPIDKQHHLESLFKNLTWLMFRLGGVGQGARRPCHKRQSNPWYRGSKLVPYGNDDPFWDLPDMPEQFYQQFQERLQGFYQALSNISGRLISSRNLNCVGAVTSKQWVEAVDSNCIIFAYQGDDRQSKKPKKHALAVLHSQEFKKNGGYDIDLCGEATRNNVQPSPVWIADAEDENYQVVTVFGATQEPRKGFVKKLLDQGAIQVFPIT
jgi:CRISPR-associated protein Cmr6